MGLRNHGQVTLSHPRHPTPAHPSNNYERQPTKRESTSWTSPSVDPPKRASLFPIPSYPQILKVNLLQPLLNLSSESMGKFMGFLCNFRIIRSHRSPYTPCINIYMCVNPHSPHTKENKTNDKEQTLGFPQDFPWQEKKNVES